MKLRTLFLSAALAFTASAFGASPAPAAGTGSGPMHGGMCTKSPDQCQQLAAKFDQWCSANADKCVALKAFVEKRRERCEANKDKCEEMMERMHERRQEKQGQSGDNGASSPPA